MDKQQTIAYFNAQVTCALIEMEGMKAENRQLAAEGKPEVYDHDSFKDIINSYGIGRNAALTLFQNCED